MLLVTISIVFAMPAFAAKDVKQNYNGKFTVEIMKDGKWAKVGSLQYRKFFKTQSIDLGISGKSDVNVRISKTGDGFLRRLLVSAAQYILGHFGKDCALREFGLRLSERGGPRAKKKAVVAVARKLGVLMLSLWKSGEDYQPQVA